MIVEVAELSKLSPAHIASERLLSSVDTLMDAKAGYVRQRTSTDLTRGILLTPNRTSSTI